MSIKSSNKIILFAGLDDNTTKLLIAFPEIAVFNTLVINDLNSTLSGILNKNGKCSDVVLLVFSSKIAHQANRKLSVSETVYILRKMNRDLPIIYFLYDEFPIERDEVVTDDKLVVLTEPGDAAFVKERLLKMIKQL
jgi:hypothetical protein